MNRHDWASGKRGPKSNPYFKPGQEWRHTLTHPDEVNHFELVERVGFRKWKVKSWVGTQYAEGNVSEDELENMIGKETHPNPCTRIPMPPEMLYKSIA